MKRKELGEGRRGIGEGGGEGGGRRQLACNSTQFVSLKQFLEAFSIQLAKEEGGEGVGGGGSEGR